MAQNKLEQHATGNAGKMKILMIVILAGILVIGVLTGTVIYLLDKVSDEETKEVIPSNRATIVTPENVEEVIAKAEEPVEAGMYFCRMNTEWHFMDSSSPSYDAYVANSTSNTHTVYFDLCLQDTGELVYSSPYMEVGAELDELILTEQLEAGEYPAIVTYNLVNDAGETLSTVSVTVTLYVES